VTGYFYYGGLGIKFSTPQAPGLCPEVGYSVRKRERCDSGESTVRVSSKGKTGI
jgi:hypothetical protein